MNTSKSASPSVWVISSSNSSQKIVLFLLVKNTIELREKALVLTVTMKDKDDQVVQCALPGFNKASANPIKNLDFQYIGKYDRLLGPLYKVRPISFPPSADHAEIIVRQWSGEAISPDQFELFLVVETIDGGMLLKKLSKLSRPEI